MVKISLLILFDLCICLYIMKCLKRKQFVLLYQCILLKCSLVRIINFEQLYNFFMFSISLSSLYCGITPGVLSWRWRPLHVLRLGFIVAVESSWYYLSRLVLLYAPPFVYVDWVVFIILL